MGQVTCGVDIGSLWREQGFDHHEGGMHVWWVQAPSLRCWCSGELGLGSVGDFLVVDVGVQIRSLAACRWPCSLVSLLFTFCELGVRKC